MTNVYASFFFLDVPTFKNFFDFADFLLLTPVEAFERAFPEEGFFDLGLGAFDLVFFFLDAIVVL